MGVLEEIAAEIADDCADFASFSRRLQKEAISEGEPCPPSEISRLAKKHGFDVPTVIRTEPPRTTGKPSQAPKRPALAPIETFPYHFISLNEKIADPEPEVKAALVAGHLLSEPLRDGHSGTIEITWEFDGPMLIGEKSRKQPDGRPPLVGPLLLDGRPVIPGATLRGLLRSTMESLALGRLEQTDKHRAFGIRDFDHDLFRNDGAGNGRAEVHAGWLMRAPEWSPESERYQIQPCRFWPIPIRRLPGVDDNGAAHLDWLVKNLPNRYEHLKRKKRGAATIDFDRVEIFDLSRESGRFERTVAVPGASGLKGVIVVSDALGTLKGKKGDQATERTLDDQKANPGKGDFKKVEHVFEHTSSAPPILLPDRVWKDFLTLNSTPSDHKPKPTGNWAFLKPTLDAGRRIPVFWVGSADQPEGIDFGLVKVFKRKLAYRVGDLLPPAHQATATTAPDFVTALFGMVREPDKGMDPGPVAESHALRHLKGRVSFGFACLEDDTDLRKLTGEAVTTVTGTPKPSFGPFYLRGTPLKDWNEKVALAGRKRYPAFSGTADDVRAMLSDPSNEGNKSPARDSRKAAVQSRLAFLEPQAGRPLRFRGEIRLHNVTAAEIGALVFALTLGGDPARRHGIGRAKAQGAGQARVAAVALGIERNDGRPLIGASAAWEAGFSVTGGALDPFVQAFGDHMRRTEPAWPDVAPVTELLGSATPSAKPRHYLPVKDYMVRRREAYGQGTGHSAPERLLNTRIARSGTGRKGPDERPRPQNRG